MTNNNFSSFKIFSQKVKHLVAYSLLCILICLFFFGSFRIPSGSLEPTLVHGDFILVNKLIYGVTIPIIHRKLINFSQPKRGDIIVFHWPPFPKQDFIKRIIGLPGDHVSYINKHLYINGHWIPQMVVATINATHTVTRKQETINGSNHDIYLDSSQPSDNIIDIVVPKNKYFVMGDNRDNSNDSRFWGFVPEKYIIGKAVAVWFSWDKHDDKIRWSRLGKAI